MAVFIGKRFYREIEKGGDDSGGEGRTEFTRGGPEDGDGCAGLGDWPPGGISLHAVAMLVSRSTDTSGAVFSGI